LWTCDGVRPGQGECPAEWRRREWGWAGGRRRGRKGRRGGRQGAKRLQRQKAKAAEEGRRGVARPDQTRRAAQTGRSDAEGRKRKGRTTSVVADGYETPVLPHNFQLRSRSAVHVNNYSCVLAIGRSLLLRLTSNYS
jgi:hypothetical protein